MRPPSQSPDLADLLVHADWVRRLARRLVLDAAQADDVVQETWVAALERPPGDARNLRGWLARVVANVARQRGRAEARRAGRERDRARPEAVPSTAELAGRAALQRDVVGHVLALDEPFRTVVLLRFFEGLAPRTIAARLDVPVKTVNSRLQRAFAKLHERLQRDYGERGAWCAALLPLCTGPGKTGAAAGSGPLVAEIGAWIVKTNTKIALAVAASVLGGWGLWRVLPDRAGAPPELPSVGSAKLAAPAPPAALDHDSERAALPMRASAAEPVDEAPAASTDTAPWLVVRGRAVGVRGQPLGGVAIATDSAPGDALATTANDGTFEVELARPDAAPWATHPDRVELLVSDPDLVTLWRASVREANAAREHVIVATPFVSIEGSVVEAGLTPVADARVRLSRLSTKLYGFPFALDMARLVELQRSTDDAGRFRFERFPEAPGLRLYVFADGYETAKLDVDEAEPPFVVQLSRSADSGGRFVDGIVVDERRAPVAGATVRLANAETTSDADGLFRIAADWVEPETPLCAAKRGFLPGLIGDFGALLEKEGGDVGPVELVLGGAPLDLRGRVVGPDGEPCARWRVSLVDETEVSQMAIPITTAESLARAGKSVVRTKRDGSFHLTGLFPRDYTLQAWDPDTLFRAEAVVAAGSQDVVLRAALETRDDARGVVVSARGEPLPGIEVELCLDTRKNAVGSSHAGGATTITDASGAFAFDAVPRDWVYLRLRGEGILPARFDLPAAESSVPHTVEVARRCHFRIEPADPSRPAESVEFLDAGGAGLQVSRFQANGMSAFSWAPLANGRSEVLSVSERATTAVIRRGGVEVARESIVLDPEIVTVLRF